jgi:hypothetical protein
MNRAVHFLVNHKAQNKCQADSTLVFRAVDRLAHLLCSIPLPSPSIIRRQCASRRRLNTDAAESAKANEVEQCRVRHCGAGKRTMRDQRSKEK